MDALNCRAQPVICKARARRGRGVIVKVGMAKAQLRLEPLQWEEVEGVDIGIFPRDKMVDAEVEVQAIFLTSSLVEA